MTPSHYPGFDVLSEKQAWDKTSRSVVTQRLRPANPKMLRQDETDTLRAVAQNLLYESRQEILDFVVSHIDSQLAAGLGESERKATLPPQDILVRRGIAALNAAAMDAEMKSFHECSPETQASLLQTLQKGKAMLTAEFTDMPQKDLFKKLLLLSVDAFASHPTIWSEMGYAGPAYPRGYYRIERQRRDPWEAVAIPLPTQGGQSNGAS